MEVGAVVTAELSWHGVKFAGIVRELHRNPDGELNGIARVEITEPGNSWHKTGEVVNIGTVALTARA